MARIWRMRSSRQKTAPKPLDETALAALALHYVGKYATSRGKLLAYLQRKLRERGWAGADEPAVSAIADRMAELRYVDDAAYAEMKAGAMQRRGLGARRIAQKLAQDGIGESDRDAVRPDDRARWEAAERLAQRRRIGPFASEMADRPTREKQIGAFLRAGHDLAMARRWIDAAPGEMPDPPED